MYIIREIKQLKANINLKINSNDYKKKISSAAAGLKKNF